MTCEGCSKEITSPKPDQRFCSAKCRVAHWTAAHIIKRKHPKRIRLRERDRLLRFIHKGESIADLRIQAREAARVQALRSEGQ